MFFWAVSYLPLADTVTFYLAGPIYVTALSVVLLGERVGWRRWTAVLVGFGGVLLALRPSAATVTLPALIALTGSIAFAFLMIVTRSLRETSNTVLVTSQIVGTLILGGLWAPFVWVTPTWRDLLLLSAFGVVSIVALACVNYSLKLAPASVVAPYQYTLIVWAIVLGYLVFGDVPDVFTLTGAAIIVAAGLFIFWREQARARQPARPLDRGALLQPRMPASLPTFRDVPYARSFEVSSRRSACHRPGRGGSGRTAPTAPSARTRVSATPVQT